MLIFENKEEIDVRGITTFGTSSKNNSQAIGFFGTGLKYAIAVLLRHNLSIEICSGSTKYFFAKVKIKIRNDEFEIVRMTHTMPDGSHNDVDLAFTTELGKTWELWQAYRELYCNTIDEKGTIEVTTKAPRPKKGFTRIIVTGLDEYHANSSGYILQTKPLYDLGRVEIHAVDEGGSGAIFYRGISVAIPHDRMLFSYNLKNKMDLTEDRTLKYIHMAQIDIAMSIAQSSIAQPIIDIITAEENTFESNLNFKYIEGYEPSETFIAAMGTQEINTVKNQSIREYFGGYAMENLENLPRKPLSEGQAIILREAKSLLLPLGFEELYSIVSTDLIADNELVKAVNSTIYLNSKIFGMEVLDIAAIIYNAFMELKYDSDSKFTIIKNAIKAQNKSKFKEKAIDPDLERQVDIEDFINEKSATEQAYADGFDPF